MKRKALIVRVEPDQQKELQDIAKSLDIKQSEIIRNGIDKEVKRLRKEKDKKVAELS